MLKYRKSKLSLKSNSKKFANSVVHFAIVGGSYAACSTVRVLAQDIIPAIESLQSNVKVTITVIAPNKDVYWNIIGPRLVVEPQLLETHHDSIFFDLEKALRKIFPDTDSHRLDIIRGKVIQVDSVNNQLIYLPLTDDGHSNLDLDGSYSAKSVLYDYCIIGSGCSNTSAAFKQNGPKSQVFDAISKLNKEINNASSICIVGAGPSGVELAGELAGKYGKEKKIALYSSASSILTDLTPRNSDNAINKLTKMGVSVFLNMRAVSAQIEDRVPKSVANIEAFYAQFNIKPAQEPAYLKQLSQKKLSVNFPDLSAPLPPLPKMNQNNNNYEDLPGSFSHLSVSSQQQQHPQSPELPDTEVGSPSVDMTTRGTTFPRASSFDPRISSISAVSSMSGFSNYTFSNDAIRSNTLSSVSTDRSYQTAETSSSSSSSSRPNSQNSSPETLFSRRFSQSTSNSMLTQSTTINAEAYNNSITTAAEKVKPTITNTTTTTHIQTPRPRENKKRYVVTFSNGYKENFDCYIPTTGNIPNSNFLPYTCLDTEGFIICDEHLRMIHKNPYGNIYCVGDIVSRGKKTLLDTVDVQPVVLKHTLMHDIIDKTASLKSYKPSRRTYLVPLSKNDGVGMYNGFVMPSLVIKTLKSKEYFMGKARKYIEQT